MKSRSAKPPTTSVTGDNRCFPSIFLVRDIQFHFSLPFSSLSSPFLSLFISKMPPSMRSCHAASQTILASISWRLAFFFHARRVRCTPHMSVCKAVKSAFSLLRFPLTPLNFFVLLYTNHSSKVSTLRKWASCKHSSILFTTCYCGRGVSPYFIFGVLGDAGVLTRRLVRDVQVVRS